jgi:hypothetical protein
MTLTDDQLRLTALEDEVKMLKEQLSSLMDFTNSINVDLIKLDHAVDILFFNRNAG